MVMTFWTAPFLRVVWYQINLGVLKVFFPFLCFFRYYVIYLPITLKGCTGLVRHVTHKDITKGNFTIQDNRIITSKANTLPGFFIFHLPVLQKGA
jgi:hypothetical protein